MTGATFTGSGAGSFQLPNGSGSGGADLGSQLGGVAQAAGQIAGNDSEVGSFFSSVATGASAGAVVGGPWGGIIGAVGGGMAAIFGGHHLPVGHEKPDIQAIAAREGITEEQAGAVVAWQANHSKDHYDDLAKYLASGGEDGGGIEYFKRLVAQWNQANPTQLVRLGAAKEAVQQVVQAQQKAINLALSTANFANTATGKQMVLALQGRPTSESIGTQGQTVGDILDAILKGAEKGGGDAAAETAWGKKFKWSYMKDWLKENQLLAFFLAIIASLGILTLVNIGRGKHGKISIV